MRTFDPGKRQKSPKMTDFDLFLVSKCTILRPHFQNCQNPHIYRPLRKCATKTRKKGVQMGAKMGSQRCQNGVPKVPLVPNYPLLVPNNPPFGAKNTLFFGKTTLLVQKNHLFGKTTLLGPENPLLGPEKPRTCAMQGGLRTARLLHRARACVHCTVPATVPRVCRPADRTHGGEKWLTRLDWPLWQMCGYTSPRGLEIH